MFIVGCWYERPCIVVAGACWWFVPVAGACWLLLQGAGSCWCWYERPCIVVATTLLVVRACCWCWYALTGCWWLLGVGMNVPVSWLLVLAGCSYRVLVVRACCWCWYALTGCWWLLGVGMNVPVLRSLLPCWLLLQGAGGCLVLV